MSMLDNFLKYISIPTNSDSNNQLVPSNKNEFKLAKLLKEQLEDLGVDESYEDKEHCYVYAKLKGDDKIPSIGFIAHLDTSENAKDFPINVNIIKNYDGKDIILDNGVLKTSIYPDLENHKGKTLITTDGNTLLGADDKAGIAEIMAMIEYFVQKKDAHGDIYIAFTSDEEIGNGVIHLDRKIFAPKYAYTVDGSCLGEISFENFNAATAEITIKGVSTHCGSAKDKMVNSLLLGNMLNHLLPNEIPANTEGYEGFYHLEQMSGNISQTTMKYLIRDFDKTNFESRKQIMQEIVNKLNNKYGDFIDLKITDTYSNMREKLEEDMEVVDIAINAMVKQGITPLIIPIRGGTDGVDLTEAGLPCPNLGTGGHNFHSNHEYIALEDMEDVVKILISIVEEYYLLYSEEKETSKCLKLY